MGDYETMLERDRRWRSRCPGVAALLDAVTGVRAQQEESGRTAPNNAMVPCKAHLVGTPCGLDPEARCGEKACMWARHQ